MPTTLRTYGGCYGIGGGGATVAFHVQAGSYDTASLIGVLKQLRPVLGGQKAALVWDGLPAHRSRAMRAFLATQRDWLVVERLPAYAPDLNPVEALWSNLKGQELANLACDTSARSSKRPGKGSSAPSSVVAAIFVPATRWPLGGMTPPHQRPEPLRVVSKAEQVSEVRDALAVSRCVAP